MHSGVLGETHDKLQCAVFAVYGLSKFCVFRIVRVDMVCCLYFIRCIVYFVACQRIVKTKLKLVTAAQLPFTRQLSIPVTRANAYQAQLAQNRMAHINGDVDLNSTSAVSLTIAASDAVTPQVN